MEVCCMVPTQVKGSPSWDGKYIHARTRSSRLWLQICHWIAQKPEKRTTSPLSLDSITYIDGTTISKHYTNSVGLIDYFLFKNCVHPIMVDKNTIVQSVVPKPLSDLVCVKYPSWDNKEHRKAECLIHVFKGWTTTNVILLQNVSTENLEVIYLRALLP